MDPLGTALAAVFHGYVVGGAIGGQAQHQHPQKGGRSRGAKKKHKKGGARPSAEPPLGRGGAELQGALASGSAEFVASEQRRIDAFHAAQRSSGSSGPDRSVPTTLPVMTSCANSGGR